MTVKIYHNPRCSKSRATMTILTDKGIEPETINYLETPPSEQELGDVLTKLDIAPTELIRFKEDKAKELNITPDDDRSNDEWISLMVNNPIIIERPIVINGNKAAIGRPPENIVSILD